VEHRAPGALEPFEPLEERLHPLVEEAGDGLLELRSVEGRRLRGGRRLGEEALP
jgi:cytochrome c-type biogenesis protein CcmH/NrfG